MAITPLDMIRAEEYDRGVEAAKKAEKEGAVLKALAIVDAKLDTIIRALEVPAETQDEAPAEAPAEAPPQEKKKAGKHPEKQ